MTRPEGSDCIAARSESPFKSSDYCATQFYRKLCDRLSDSLSRAGDAVNLAKQQQQQLKRYRRPSSEEARWRDSISNRWPAGIHLVEYLLKSFAEGEGESSCDEA